jgi:RNA polymerase sigma-70 factor (ECF subfamily)
MDEHQGLQLLKQGNPQGLEVLVERYYFAAVRAAYLIVGDRDQAEDIVQECFIHAYQKIDQLNSDRFGPWFYRSVVNASLKTYKKSARSVSLDDVEEKLPISSWPNDPHFTPEDEAQHSEFKESVREALARLPAEQRAAIVWKYFLELSESEISLRANRPVSTIKWWLYAARRKMRAWLSPYTDLPGEQNVSDTETATKLHPKEDENE